MYLKRLVGWSGWWPEVEVFFVLKCEVAKHQHYRMVNRINRLLQKGRRYRGDILTA